MSSVPLPVLAPPRARNAPNTRLADPARLAALRASRLLGGAASPVLDRLTRLTCRLLGVPVALVSLVDDQGQHFPGLTGLGGWAGAARGTPLSHSFCQHVVASGDALVVADAHEHPLVRDNGAVADLGVRAYLGVPLTTASGDTLGAFCAIDTAPRAWTADEVEGLRDLARTAAAELEVQIALGAPAADRHAVRAVDADIARRGDRWMTAFLAAHGAVALALAPVHDTWTLAALVTAAAGGAFALARWRRPGSLLTRVVAGVALQAFCALHIHQMHGLAEMHFFYFTATTAMIIYQDWRALWPGILAIIAQHTLFSWWHNRGLYPGGVPFFEPHHVTPIKLAFHYGIALAQAAVASYWAHVLRRRTVRDAAANARLHAQTMALEAQVTARDVAHVGLAASERRFRTVVESIDQGLLLTDLDGRVVYANSRAGEITGYAVDELVGSVAYEALVPAAERPAALDRLGRRRDGQSERYEVELVRKDGSRVSAEVGSVPFRDDAGGMQGVLAVVADTTARKALEAELTRRAFEDPLTGLANRARFREAAALALASMADGAGPAVLLVDLDDFKTVNDSLGHAAGDRLLVRVAERLLHATRGADTVARLGGDEFAVLLAGVTCDADARRAADRVVAALAAPLDVGGRTVRSGASVGIAVARGGETPDELLRNADLALYRAKGRGKGAGELFVPAMHTAAVERLEVEAELREAIAAGALEVHYQPVVDLATGVTRGAEALVRWPHPTRGMVPPSAFIPVAESTGLILPLGTWVLDQACRTAAGWAGEGPDAAAPTVAVNVSGLQLQHPGFVDDVAAALRASGLAPARLVLEVTESVLLADLDAALARLDTLRVLGVQLALDDFGTGYSSLAYLQRLPVDLLKIDRTFTADITAGGRRAAFARAVLRLADTLGLRTVAEGVETAEQHAALRALGCRFGQGYWYARPMTAAAFARFRDANAGVVAGTPA